MKRVEITIGEDGEARIEAFGFKGPHCEKATRPFELTLGTPIRRERKVDQETEARQAPPRELQG